MSVCGAILWPFFPVTMFLALTRKREDEVTFCSLTCYADCLRRSQGNSCECTTKQILQMLIVWFRGLKQEYFTVLCKKKIKCFFQRWDGLLFLLLSFSVVIKRVCATAAFSQYAFCCFLLLTIFCNFFWCVIIVLILYTWTTVFLVWF